MNSDHFSSDRCFKKVWSIIQTYSGEDYLDINITGDDINQMQIACNAEYDMENSDKFSKPMVWIGIYIAIASLFCVFAMVADLWRGIRNKKFWFPCKYFSLNAASITVITVAMKLPVDLSTDMSSYTDQATKVGSLGFMCVMMANLMPSLASMDNNTLLANVIGLCILVITMIVNICIQMNTGVILKNLSSDLHFGFATAACIYTITILMLLLIMISLSLTIPTSKEVLESKYQAKNKMSFTDRRMQHTQQSTIEKLKQHVKRYWVMAETGSPQFRMANNPLSTASGLICVMVMVINCGLVYIFIAPFGVENLQRILKNSYGSTYKWSISLILLTQYTGVVVGSIAPIARCFSDFSFKLGNEGNINYFMFFKVEKYWTQKLHEWKQSPVPFVSSSRRSKSLVHNSKDIILSLFIAFQTVIVVLCKVIWLVVSKFVVSCFYCWKSLKERWFTTPITLRIDDIDENLTNYVLQLDNEMELSADIMKRISNSMNSFILKAEKEQSNNLLKLLEKSTSFEGVEIFDTDRVQPLLPVELGNSWSLPIITLTCIVVALPSIRRDKVESLLIRVGEGLSYTHIVEESLCCAGKYVNIWKTTQILWHEVEHKCKWLGNPLAKNAFKGKTTTEILKCFSDKSKEIVAKVMESTNGELVENPHWKLIAANSMYRITQTILLRYQSNKETITKNQLYAHLNGMIADIFSACFTNIPRVITMRCQESAIEKREASVKVAAKLLGKTTKIIERLETLELPSMDDEKMAHIDEWRLYLKQPIP